MKIVLSILIWMFVIACKQDREQRLKNDPNNAIWIGGADGGCWIQYGVITDSSIEATIFHENGEVWEKGILKKQGNCKISKETLGKTITGFDGENLLTSERCSFRK